MIIRVSGSQINYTQLNKPYTQGIALFFEGNKSLFLIHEFVFGKSGKMEKLALTLSITK